MEIGKLHGIANGFYLLSQATDVFIVDIGHFFEN